MGASKRICPNCGRKMKQQFVGLFHCKCGTSWRHDIGFFERTPDMVFSLERKKVGNKVKQLPTIHHKINSHRIFFRKSIRSAWPGCFSSGAVRCGCLFFMPCPLS